MEVNKMRGIAALWIILASALSLVTYAGVQDLTYDSFNNATNISYDGLNRILAKNFSSEQYNYSYDADYLGTLANVTFKNGSIAYKYDDKLRITKETRTIDGIKFEKVHYYDSADRLVRIDFNPGNSSQYVYGSRGLVEMIAGFVNNTRHNAFGSVLNRTYGSGKVTNFTYDAANARLRRINTDSVQNLMYEYDSVGNVVAINDSANSRYLTMSYDFLDRLLNTSVNGGQSFAYSYDAIGNLFRIVKDSASVTRLFYGNGLVHAPGRVVSGDASVIVHSAAMVNNSNRSRVVEFVLRNDENRTATAVNWTVGFGDDSNLASSIDFNLAVNESVAVFVEHSYAAGGGYGVNVTAGSLAVPSDFDKISARFGIRMRSINVTAANLNVVNYEFVIYNDLNENVSGVTWQCNNGLSSGSSFTVAALSNYSVAASYAYGTAGVKNLNCSAASSNGSDSTAAAFEIKGVKIEAYNRSMVDADTVEFGFNVTNYWNPRNFNWRVASDGQSFTGSTGSLSTGSSVVVAQQVNYTSAGSKSVVINVTSTNLSDSLTDRFDLKSIEIEDFYSHNTTATGRVFDFWVRNYWTSNLTSGWNMSEPAVASPDFNLSSGEAVMVFVEADYATQGVKSPVVKAYSGSVVSSVLDKLSTRLIDAFAFRTVFESRNSSITEAFIRSNKAAYDVSWVFYDGKSAITSNSATFVNTTQDVALIIESTYSDSGVHNSSLTISSSSLNQSVGGVVIT